jgi:hypothetical protein
MTMTNLIERITNAIVRQEGHGPEHQNPGSLRDCPWFPVLMKDGKPWVPPLAAHAPKITRYYPDTKTAAGDVEYVQFSPANFWIPRSRAEGIAGAAHVVALHIAKGESLRQLISSWAPPGDGNDTESYIQHVAEWAGIPSVDLALWNYIQETAT